MNDHDSINKINAKGKIDAKVERWLRASHVLHIANCVECASDDEWLGV